MAVTFGNSDVVQNPEDPEIETQYSKPGEGYKASTVLSRNVSHIKKVRSNQFNRLNAKRVSGVHI